MRFYDLSQANLLTKVAIVTDVVDRANQEAEAFLSESLRQHSNLAANDITECVECGADIGEKRKRILPYATRCIDCQQRLESKLRSKR